MSDSETVSRPPCCVSPLWIPLVPSGPSCLDPAFTSFILDSQYLPRHAYDMKDHESVQNGPNYLCAALQDFIGLQFVGA